MHGRPQGQESAKEFSGVTDEYLRALLFLARLMMEAPARSLRRLPLPAYALVACGVVSQCQQFSTTIVVVSAKDLAEKTMAKTVPTKHRDKLDECRVHLPGVSCTSQYSPAHNTPK